MRDIYLFSGLGADMRVFQNMNFGEHRVHYIEWMAPIEGETLSDYSFRIAGGIQSHNPVLIGVSFGGVVALETARHLPNCQIIAISSVVRTKSLPWYFRAAGKLRVHRLVPKSMMKQSNRIIEWLFGVVNNDERKLLRSILLDSSPEFTSWAVERLLSWKNDSVPANLITIHGTKDRLLPSREAKHHIDGGGHFMIATHASIISSLIRQILDAPSNGLD